MNNIENLHICVTGGAGYIGSHVVLQLLERTSCSITILDNFATSANKSIVTLMDIAKRKNKLLRTLVTDLTDKSSLVCIFQKYNFDAIFHLAAYSLIEEGEKNPNKYEKNNLNSTKNLLECMDEFSVKYLVFSSSAAIYESSHEKLMESSSKVPDSVYGKTKLKCENLIKKFENSIHYTNLRFFNAVGCDSKYRIGERHDPESHLLPLVAKAIINNKHFTINGDSYNTKDGTCIRDFIHVEDIVGYHLASLEYMIVTGRSSSINCGYSIGHSILDIIQVMKYVSQKNLELRVAPKRKVDSAILVADNTLLNATIGKYYVPIYKSNISLICEQVYRWEILKMQESSQYV